MVMVVKVDIQQRLGDIGGDMAYPLEGYMGIKILVNLIFCHFFRPGCSFQAPDRLRLLYHKRFCFARTLVKQMRLLYKYNVSKQRIGRV